MTDAAASDRELLDDLNTLCGIMVGLCVTFEHNRVTPEWTLSVRQRLDAAAARIPNLAHQAPQILSDLDTLEVVMRRVAEIQIAQTRQN